ncbi:hypothetical protein BC940DRAFT_274071 [Gongronella butleri]|nr:hypothetical protein BC940DRAFT_274071 [Gongronella butleri]
MFRLPADKLPGKDMISKQILDQQEVIDLAAHDLLDVPFGTYATAETEWRTRRKPCLAIQTALPPILIEIQLVVNEQFMQRIMSYAQNALQLYKVYPIVLIFCTDWVSPGAFMAKFKLVAMNKNCAKLTPLANLCKDSITTRPMKIDALSLYYFGQSVSVLS